MFIKLGANLHHVCVDDAASASVVIFVNSLGTDVRIWDAVVAGLNGSIRAVRYDMRGHGLTPPTSPPYSVQELARDLEELISALPVERATLCGISVGGQVALQAAADRPDRIDGLVLCDTGYRIGTHEMWSQRIAAVNEGGMAAISSAVVARWLSEEFRAANPETTAGYQYMLERCTVAGYTGVCAALRDADLEAIARGIRCPTVVLCGDEDQATPVALNRALAAAIPGARFEEIRGAAHLPCIEQPEAVVAQLAAFIGQHVDV